MNDGLAVFNGLPPAEAERRLRECFSDPHWATTVVAGRPYRDSTALILAAEAAWSDLTDADWRAVFESHPRIGERGGHSPAASEREQSQAALSSPETAAALSAENRAYEARFGHVFLIAAAGRGAEEVLGELRRRMNSQPAAELETAKQELRKISRMRIERMLSP